MKKLLWLAVIMGFGAAGSTFAAEEGSPSLPNPSPTPSFTLVPVPGGSYSPIGPIQPEEADFRVANPALQSILEGVISGDELIDFAYPRFDEHFCDLKAEKLKYDAQGSLKNTPWLEGGRADGMGTSTYVADRTPGHVGVSITASGSVRTDVLALIRYSAYVANKRSWPLDPQFEGRYRAHLKRLAVATSLDQVYALLLTGHQLARDMIVSEIERLENELKQYQETQCMPQCDQEIAKVTMRLNQTKGTLPEYDRPWIETKKSDGRIIEIQVLTDNLSGFIPEYSRIHEKFRSDPAYSKVNFSDKMITASGEAFVAAPENELDRLKKKLNEKLLGLQRGDSHTRDDAQGMFRDALIETKKFLRGKF
jgi:hypothetical protein